MKKSVNLLLIFFILIGQVSCKENESVSKLTLSSTTLEIKIDGTATVNVLEGNGGYRINIEDPTIVKAVISENSITFTGVSRGSTTVVISDGKNQSTPITINVSYNVDEANTITFNASKTDGEKQGNIGFLHSINLTAPADSFVTLIKPKLWRVGRYNNAFKLYHRLQELGVERQLLALSDLRTEVPYRSIFQEHGYGVMAGAIVEDVIELGLDYEFDLYNEPNRMSGFNLDSFMDSLWIPAYRAIREKLPNAIIHGPATSINSTGDPKGDSLVMFQFIDKAIESNTLPDYMNWHLQIGYNIADWHKDYAEKIEAYINAKGHTILGCVVGETVRPGDERNTSPGKLVDVFLAAEAANIPQIRAAWSSTPVYGVSTSIPPVLCGILTGTDGKGRRGAWWTYRFFAETEGTRIESEERLTGSENLVGIAFRDDTKKVVRALVGLRDGLNEQNALLSFTNLNSTSYIAENGKTRLKMWYNYQTQGNVTAFGSDFLPLIMDEEVEIVDGRIEIPVRIHKWDAVLIELSSPSAN